MIRIVSADFAQMKADADRFDKGIIRGLRKEFRELGKDSTDEVKKTVRLSPPSGGGDSVGSRDAVAAGTRLQMSFAKRGAGVKIVTANNRLDKAHRGFAAAYNSGSFRHPVFGNRQAFVQQTGRPYFGVSIERVLDDQAIDRMKAAIDTANRAIGAHGA